MTLDVPNEYEEVLRNAVASGDFANEEEALRHALELLAIQQRKAAPIAQMPERIDIDELAANQGVKPFRADMPVQGIWPEDESTDEFLVFLTQTRQEGDGNGAAH